MCQPAIRGGVLDSILGWERQVRNSGGDPADRFSHLSPLDPPSLTYPRPPLFPQCHIVPPRGQWSGRVLSQDSRFPDCHRSRQSRSVVGANLIASTKSIPDLLVRIFSSAVVGHVSVWVIAEDRRRKVARSIRARTINIRKTVFARQLTRRK